MPAVKIFDDVANKLLEAELDLENVTITMSLVTATWTPDVLDTAGNINTHEVTASGYVAQTVSGETGTGVFKISGATGFYCAPATFAQNADAGFTDARYAVLHTEANLATSGAVPLVYVDLEQDRGNQAGDLTIEFDGNGKVFDLTIPSNSVN